LSDIISIIILTYNNEEYLVECLDSILKQNYKSIEIIINDDGSRVFNSTRFEEYINKHKGPNIVNYQINVNTVNIGTVKSINNCIKKSIGDYVLPLSCDDKIYEECTLSNIVTFFKENQCLIFTGYRKLYNQDMTQYLGTSPNEKEKLYFSGTSDSLYRNLCIHKFISGACTPFKKGLINIYGFFDEDYRLLEDYPKYLNITRNGCNIPLANFSIIKYRMGGISTSVTKMNPMLRKDFNLAIKKEILPFKSITGIYIYRIKAYEYLKKTFKGNKIIKVFALIVKFPDMVILKTFWQIVNSLKSL
jgi:glycosyltransferase involved in cell wall biosynthesis